MADKIEDYQENNQTAYKGTAGDDDITVVDIDFNGSSVYTFEGNDTVVIENPDNKLEIWPTKKKNKKNNEENPNWNPKSASWYNP